MPNPPKRPAIHAEIEQIKAMIGERHTKIAKRLNLHPSVVLAVINRFSTKNPKKRQKRAKMGKRGREYAKVRKIHMAEHYVCEICGNRNSLSIHHIAGRAGSLLTDRSNFLVVCLSGSWHLSRQFPESNQTEGCHHWIERNLKLARQMGWSRSKIKQPPPLSGG